MRKIIVLINISLILFSTGISQVISYSQQSDGVLFKLKTGAMKIYLCRDNIFRVSYAADTVLPSKTILTVNKVWGKTEFTINENDSSIIIETSRIKASVSKNTSLISYYTHSNDIILSEDSRKIIPTTAYGVNSNKCITTFNSLPNEAVYGLGQHQQGVMNYKGKKQWLDQANKEIGLPIIISSKGYGILWDNYSKTLFDASLYSNTKYQFNSLYGNMVDYYFMYGPNLDTVISAYRTATGTAPLFPKWAYGLFQSKNRYSSESELIDIKNEYRNNGIPVDCIVQDWYYWDPYPWGSNIMNPTYYPHPSITVDSLHAAHIHTMISIWSTFTEGTANYNQYKAINALYPSDGTRHYYDPHNQQARSIYWQQVRDQLFQKYGWDAWWADADEPDTYPDTYNRDEANTALGKGILYHNTYPLMHTTSVYEGWRKDIKDKRLFTLSRCAFLGNQRNAAASWSGDINTTWTSFKTQLSAGLNFCLSGIPYWTTDIGGYSYNWQSTNWGTKSNRELFIRWFEYGTFCPIYRIHGVDDKSLLSNFWDSSTKSILLKYDKLRYRFMPYIYSLAWMVTSKNYTIMRHLVLDNRTDPNVFNIFDQFMFGPYMMINPVWTEGATKRTVYLPNGNWYNFWTGDKVNGGSSIITNAPLDTIPIFIKAGSIIPMGPNIQYATQSADPLEIRVYRGADAKFVLYEDEGNTYNYEQGQYSLIPFTYNEASKQLTIGARQGTYNGMPESRTFNIVFVNSNRGTGLEVTSSIDTVIHYKGSEEVITGISSNNTNVLVQFNLEQNYPNPFNPTTKIKYSIAKSGNVSLKVYNILGQIVRILFIGYQKAGYYQLTFDASKFASGIYFYRLQCDKSSLTKKMLSMK